MANKYKLIPRNISQAQIDRLVQLYTSSGPAITDVVTGKIGKEEFIVTNTGAYETLCKAEKAVWKVLQA